jgi:protein-L-isoaspartate(D-aspartate) O-methyltransferase
MSTDFTAARLNMVESQIRTADVTDLPLQDALRVVARESVVPASKAYLAYADADIEYAPGRWLLRPREVGKLLQTLKPREGEKALAIAAPYAAAVLEKMGLAVTRLEGDDLKAVPAGSYDVIICEGAVALTPKAWRDAWPSAVGWASSSAPVRWGARPSICAPRTAWVVARPLTPHRRCWRASRWKPGSASNARGGRACRNVCVKKA